MTYLEQDRAAFTDEERREWTNERWWLASICAKATEGGRQWLGKQAAPDGMYDLYITAEPEGRD